ncbi:hypothetical protein B0O99DRAFT_54339 [Bisporella sp. PMI_857]|nr:hypothetical protein B0O99DRAFT_54339 [Bisporella sp. PMI_857]
MAPGRKKKEPSIEPLPTQTPAPSRRTRTQRKELEAADPSSVSPLLSLSDQKKTRVRKAPVKKGSPLKNAVEPQSSPEAASSSLELMPQLPPTEDEDASPEPSREYTEEYIPQSNHTNEDLTSNLMDLLDAKSSSTNPSQETFQEPGAESFASASGFGHHSSPQLIHSQMKAYRDSHDHNPSTPSRVTTQSEVLYEQIGEASEPTAPHSTYTRRISAVTYSSSSTKGVPTHPTSSISSQNSQSQVPSPDTHSTTHLALNTVTSSASELQHLGRRKHFRTRDDEEEKDEDTQRPAKRLRKQFPPPSTPQPSKKKRYLTPKPKSERIRRALQMPPKASTTSEDRQELRRDFPNHLPFSRPFQQDQADEEDEESPMIVHGYELERLQPQPLWTGGLRQNEFLVKGGFGWKMNETSLASPNDSTNKQEVSYQ